MNWDAISAVSETIASIAVIISLVYLAQQIRQSNKLSQSQTRTELRHMANSEVAHLITHPEIWLLMWKEELTLEEKSRLNSFLISAFRFREFIWRQYNMGLLDDATFRTYINVIVQLLQPARCRRWWDNYTGSPVFDPEWVAFVDQLLKESKSGVTMQYLIENL